MPGINKARITVALAVLSVACSAGEIASSDLSVSTTSSTMHSAYWTPDDEDARIAREDVKGYAGIMSDANGVLTVLLSDTTSSRSKRAVLEERWNSTGRIGGMANHLSTPKISHVKAVRYDFNILKTSRDRIAGAALRGIDWTFLDIDEANNQVLISVSSERQMGLVRHALDVMGLPRDLVAIDVRPHVISAEPAAEEQPPGSGLCIGLQCNQSGIYAGIETDWVKSSNGLVYACTVGTLTKIGTDLGFITASHCSSDYSGFLDYTFFYPGSSVGSSTAFGIKHYDPTYTPTPGCPAGFACRASDAQFAIVNGSWANGFGHIAKPYAMNDPDSSVALPISSLTGFDIVSERVPPYVNLAAGTLVNKVGRTTGWTQGAVVSTCITVSYGIARSGAYVAYTCQYAVGEYIPFGGLLARQGDSGAPVFTVVSGSSVMVEGYLTAISSGGVPGTSTNKFYFSTFFNALTDIHRASGPTSAFMTTY